MSRCKRQYDFDVLIVGAGIVGVWTAFSFTKYWQGRSICVLEQSGVGGGASNESAGYDAVESADPVQRALACRSRILYRDISGVVPAAAAQKVNTVWVVDESEADAFANRFDDGSGGVRLRPIRGLDGFSVPPKSVLLTEDESGFARPGDICRALMAHLVASHDSVSVQVGARVVEVAGEDAATFCKMSDGRKVCAKVTVLATGAYPILESGNSRATNLALRRKKVASLIVDRMPSSMAAAVVYQSAGCFFLPDAARRRWLFSFNLATWDVPWSSGASLTDDERLAGLTLLRTFKPEFVHFAERSQVSFDFYSQDRRPRAIAVNPHLWFVGGFSGGGFRWAPAFIDDFVRRLTEADDCSRGEALSAQ